MNSYIKAYICRPIAAICLGVVVISCSVATTASVAASTTTRPTVTVVSNNSPWPGP
jgi:hypothetical protein